MTNVKAAKPAPQNICAMDDPTPKRAHRNMPRAAALGLLGTAISLTAAWDTPAPSSRLTLVYVGASDCAPCRSWQKKEGSRFQSSTEFSRLEYREIKSPTLRDILSDQHWPEDLRSYRAQIGGAAAVPLWLVIADNHVVAKAFGTTGWTERIQPYLKTALR